MRILNTLFVSLSDSKIPDAGLVSVRVEDGRTLLEEPIEQSTVESILIE